MEVDIYDSSCDLICTILYPLPSTAIYRVHRRAAKAVRQCVALEQAPMAAVRGLAPAPRSIEAPPTLKAKGI